MTRLWNELGRGALAGAAGTAALSAVTYLDMAVRGRPASTTPEQSVERLSQATHVPIPGDEQARGNRVTGLGALGGIAVGVSVGAGYALLRAAGLRLPTWAGALLTGAAAMAGTDVPMAVAGLTDPGRWGAAGWLSDAVPHAAYGTVTAATFAATDPGRRRAG